MDIGLKLWNSILKPTRLKLWIYNLILLLIIIPLFVPFSPKMPSPGVDTSWALALNQAVAQGLVFGRDLIFTLGPYSAIYTKMYHPVTDGMMFWGSVYLACSYWLALLVLGKQVPGFWKGALAFFLLTLVYAKDSLFFSYPLLVGLIGYRFLLRPYESLPLWLLGILFAPFGLLVLIKGSFLILCLFIAGCCSFILALYHHYLKGLLVLVIPLVALLFFWILAGQAIEYLPSYLKSSLLMAFSFTEAMSTRGNDYEVVAYLIAGFSILCFIANQNLPKKSALFLLSLFFMFLFLSFKTGFARHLGHALIPATSILMAALLLPYVLRSKGLLPVLILALSASFYIEAQYTRITLVKNIQSTYTAAWYGLLHRLQDSDWLEHNFNLTMTFLQGQSTLPLRPGTSDIYSFDQTELIASGNTWCPRPIIQSYSVFNSQLAEINQQHLLGRHSPDTIFFKMQPIDHRFPALEDGLSWSALLNNYQPKSWVHDYLILAKKRTSEEGRPAVQEISEVHALGERVHVPDSSSRISMAFELRPTLWGRIVSFFFKPEELNIWVSLSDGSERQYRFIPAMARSEFLLSPLIEDTQDFSLLYQNPRDLDDKHVQFFTIKPEGKSASMMWNLDYVIHYLVH